MALLFRKEFKSFDDDGIEKLTIFDEVQLNQHITLKNRVIMAPMTTCASNDDLTVADDEADYYAARSTGVSMVVTGTTFFQENGQGFPNQFAATSDDFIPSLKKLADAIKGQGAKAVLQIFHAGRMAITEDLVAPSAVKPSKGAFGAEPRMPRELSEEEINEIINGFYDATRRAIAAGFDGVEIHGANGYLIQQFFSGESNVRTDAWGGSLENRVKFPLAVIEAVNKAKKEFAKEEFIVGYRLSPEEEEGENGITLEDTLFLVDKLADEELEYIHLSTAHYKSTQKRDKTDRRYMGAVILEKVNGRRAVIGVGEVMTKVDGNNALAKVGYDLIALGHSIVSDPDWVEKVEKDEQPDMFIHPNDLAAQHIPVKMADMIKSVKNWFYFM